MESLALADDLFQACRQHGTDRGVLFRRQYSGLAQQIGIQLECDIGFHMSTQIRVAQYYVQAQSNVNEYSAFSVKAEHCDI